LPTLTLPVSEHHWGAQKTTVKATMLRAVSANKMNLSVTVRSLRRLRLRTKRRRKFCRHICANNRPKSQPLQKRRLKLPTPSKQLCPQATLTRP